MEEEENQVTTNTQQFVRIEFHDSKMNVIPRLSLDSANSTVLHRAFARRDTTLS